MRKILLTLALMTALVGAITIALPGRQTFADAKAEVCKGIGLGIAADDGTCKPDAGSPTVESLVGTVIKLLSYVVGVTAIIMIIIGAFKYVTSNGDSSSVTSAKNTIMYALIGIVVAVLAQVLVRFVFTKVTETPATIDPTSVPSADVINQ